MPLREPRLELDRMEVNKLLGWSGVSMVSVCSFIKNIPESSAFKMNDLYIYNRGYVELEDTERRRKDCWMISIWSAPITQSGSECLFQQPIPIKLRVNL